MKITNKTNILDPLYRAITKDSYSGRSSWRTATELVRAPQEVFLRKKHDEEITEDAQDLFYRFLGTMAHLVVEKSADDLIKSSPKDGWKSEERIYLEIAGKQISGQFDLYNTKTKTLYDIKTCSGFEVAKNKPLKHEWIGQMKILIALLHSQGLEVKDTYIQRIVRDWSASTRDRMDDFPEHPFIDVKLPPITAQEATEYLKARVALHLEYERSQSPECTAEERYATPEQWAVMKDGVMKARKLFTDKALASSYALELGKGHRVDHRPSDNKRCRLYCPVSQFCPTYKRMKESK